MIRLVIKGHPESKSNFRASFGKNREAATAAHERYKSYEKAIKLQANLIRHKYKINTITEDCTILAWFYFKDYRKRDVGNYQKSVFDALQAGKIVKDDVQFKTIILEGFVDKDNPRVEIEIYPNSTLANKIEINIVEKKDAPQVEAEIKT